MNRLPALSFTLLVVSVAGVFASSASAASGTVFEASIPSTSLPLSTGQTVTVSGDLSVAIAQLKVEDGRIVANATLTGSLTGTTSSGDAVVATFTETRIVAQVSDVQADCQAGTLSFSSRAVVPPNGIEVTVNDTPVSLKRAIKLTVPIAISTADISDPAAAAKVGAIICRIDRLLGTGGSLGQIVNQLNALLRALA